MEIWILLAYIGCACFLAGLSVGMDEKWWVTLLALLFGPVIAAGTALLWVLRKIDGILEIRILLSLVFKKKWSNPDFQDVINAYYHKLWWYKKWVIRMIARKYGYTIPKE